MSTSALPAKKLPELANVHTPLLYNHWYVAGTADEFDSGLHERTFLNRSIVIFRTDSGALSALQNRCAHRSFPLAHGIREGDGIRCRYHGAKYDADGKIVEVPSMVTCPRASVRRYPIEISGTLAWIWMGDEEPTVRPPSTPWLGEGWTHATGTFPLEGNWLLMAENLMDLTHIPFLHAATFQFSRGYAETPITVETDGDRLRYYRENPPGYHRTAMMRPALSDALELNGYNATSGVEFVSPALSLGRGEFIPKQPDKMSQGNYMWRIAHFTTPETQSRSHYWFFHARNYDLDDIALTEEIRDLMIVAFQEDKLAIELIQKLHTEDQHDYREVHFKSDAPGVGMRRIVADMATREGALRSAVEAA